MLYGQRDVDGLPPIRHRVFSVTLRFWLLLIIEVVKLVLGWFRGSSVSSLYPQHAKP